MMKKVGTFLGVVVAGLFLGFLVTYDEESEACSAAFVSRPMPWVASTSSDMAVEIEATVDDTSNDAGVVVVEQAEQSLAIVEVAPAPAPCHVEACNFAPTDPCAQFCLAIATRVAAAAKKARPKFDAMIAMGNWTRRGTKWVNADDDGDDDPKPLAQR